MDDPDFVVRSAAFNFLAGLKERHGDSLPRSELQSGFDFEGQRIPLLGPQGIFKPAAMKDMPLSITTAPLVEGKVPPYDDTIEDDRLITYR